MKLIVYQIGKDEKASRVALYFRELGRALAILDQDTDEYLIKPDHRVITR